MSLMPVDYRHRSHASRTIYHAWLTNRDHEFFFNTWLIMKVKFSFTKIYPKKALCVDFVSWMYPQHYSQENKEKKRNPDQGRGVRFWRCTRGKKGWISKAEYCKLGRYGDMLTRKCFKFRGSEMPFPAFSTRYFQ